MNLAVCIDILCMHKIYKSMNHRSRKVSRSLVEIFLLTSPLWFQTWAFLKIGLMMKTGGGQGQVFECVFLSSCSGNLNCLVIMMRERQNKKSKWRELRALMLLNQQWFHFIKWRLLLKWCSPIVIFLSGDSTTICRHSKGAVIRFRSSLLDSLGYRIMNHTTNIVHQLLCHFVIGKGLDKDSGCGELFRT